MYKYPHTISNGHGEELTFLRRVAHPDGDYLEVENVVQPNSGPPMHLHYLQEEALTVASGRIGYQEMGKEAQFAGEGETVVFKPGVAHKFWNAGEIPLRCTGYVRPAHNIDYFLGAIYDSMRESKNGRPNAADTAYLLHRYRSEFEMYEIPAFVQTIIFPIQRLIGALTGRFKKYEDAPEPAGRVKS
jgi:quercetin dioxygenase-like cupin family protein